MVGSASRLSGERAIGAGAPSCSSCSLLKQGVHSGSLCGAAGCLPVLAAGALAGAGWGLRLCQCRQAACGKAVRARVVILLLSRAILFLGSPSLVGVGRIFWSLSVPG